MPIRSKVEGTDERVSFSARLPGVAKSLGTFAEKSRDFH